MIKILNDVKKGRASKKKKGFGTASVIKMSIIVLKHQESQR